MEQDMGDVVGTRRSAVRHSRQRTSPNSPSLSSLSSLSPLLSPLPSSRASRALAVVWVSMSKLRCPSVPCPHPRPHPAHLQHSLLSVPLAEELDDALVSDGLDLRGESLSSVSVLIILATGHRGLGTGRAPLAFSLLAMARPSLDVAVPRATHHFDLSVFYSVRVGGDLLGWTEGVDGWRRETRRRADVQPQRASSGQGGTGEREQFLQTAST